MLWTALLLLQTPLYLNPDAGIERRVDDLVGRMTLEEKVSQMKHQAGAIPRLGVPAYQWWNEALHGVARLGYATVFPQGIGLGAMWDPALMHRIGDAISTEARAKYNNALKKSPDNVDPGLDYWAPNINIFRDPRWGRGQETYGEDPYLTGRNAVQFIKGLQGDDIRYLKTIATPKHFAVHSGPEPIRNRFDAVASKQDLFATYLPQFEAAIREGDAYSIMGSYNRVNGVPSNANAFLLDDILRKQWSFKGYVVSDCGAITNIWADHHFASTKEDADALAVKAGCDLECGGDYIALVGAVKQGKITEAQIDVSVKRLMTARMRMGMFDPPSLVPWSKIPLSIVNCDSHKDLALQAARESMVLLKNDIHLLPLSDRVHRIAVIGPNAADVNVMLGNYNGTPKAPISVLAGIREAAKRRGIEVSYARGSGISDFGHAAVPASQLMSRDGKAGGLTAEYFAGRELQGPPLLVRTEVPDFDWGEGSPGPGVPKDEYSVRWQGSVVPAVSGSYTFGFTADDGVRVWVDDKLLIDQWSDHGPTRFTGAVNLVGGHPASIKIEYYEHAIGAVAKLDWATPASAPYDDAVQAASTADVVVMALGINGSLEDEGLDRATLDLPDVQEKLLERVQAMGKPIVLVCQNGSPLALNWANDHVQTILEAWYPGESGGRAVADVLFGDYNPAGRLPVTFPRSLNDVPEFTSYAMQGRTYRYWGQGPFASRAFTPRPLFEFGFGLSYTTFEYSNAKAVRKPGGPWEVSATVTNTGQSEGDEVVQMYVAHQHPPFAAPVRELKGFKRLHLLPNESRTVRFPLGEKELSLVDLEGRRVQVGDLVRVSLGGRQPHLDDPVAKGQTVSVEVPTDG